MTGRSGSGAPGPWWKPWALRLYRLLLRALPPGIRRDDGDAMVRTLEDQLGAAARRSDGLAVLSRALRRLPAVVVMEWVDAVRVQPDGGWGKGDAGAGRPGAGEMLRHARLAGRALRKSPAFTGVTVLLVGVGVGAVTAVFTVVDHVLLRPLPYPAEERLAYLTNGSHNGATLRGLDDVDAFELWTATTGADVNLTMTGGEPVRLRAVEATPSFFTLFDARPALGRVLVEADRDDRGVAVLTHDAWTSVWGGDPGVVGSVIRLDGEPVQVVGVLARDFVVPESVVGRRVQLFRPVNGADPRLDRPGFHTHSVTVRLAPGVDLATADAQVARLAERVAARFPEHYRDGPPSWPLQTLRDRTVRDVEEGLALLLGAVGLLLLVACANVAHLFMARGLGRMREMAVRRALGAGTRVLVGQLALESLLVGLGGGVLGLALAWGGLEGFRRWVAALPRGDAVALDLRVLLFAAALASLTALAFGLIPALRTVGRDVEAVLRRWGRGSTGGPSVRLLRSGLVAGEVALSLVLVALAGLLLRSFLAADGRDPGIEAEGAWAVPLNPAGVQDADGYRLRMEGLVRALRPMPGVVAVTYGLEAPFQVVGGDRCCWNLPTAPVEGGEAVDVAVHPVTEGFFPTFGTDLVAGTSWDRTTVAADPPPVVVSETLALRLFGSAEAAVGRELEFFQGRVRVAGVAEDVLHYGLDQPAEPGWYLPVEELPFAPARATLAFRVAGPEAGLAGRVRQAIWSVEPDLPVPAVVPLTTWVDESAAGRRAASALSGAFGIVALLLAAGGLYGTLLYTVGQQRKELGIRLALGARRGRVQARIVGRGLGVAGLGVTAGAVLAWAGGRLVENMIYGVAPRDPVALSAAAAVLLATAGLASWLPARRAARTDPRVTLDAE